MTGVGTDADIVEVFRRLMVDFVIAGFTKKRNPVISVEALPFRGALGPRAGRLHNLIGAVGGRVADNRTGGVGDERIVIFVVGLRPAGAGHTRDVLVETRVGVENVAPLHLGKIAMMERGEKTVEFAEEPVTLTTQNPQLSMLVESSE